MPGRSRRSTPTAANRQRLAWAQENVIKQCYKEHLLISVFIGLFSDILSVRIGLSNAYIEWRESLIECSSDDGGVDCRAVWQMHKMPPRCWLWWCWWLFSGQVRTYAAYSSCWRTDGRSHVICGDGPPPLSIASFCRSLHQAAESKWRMELIEYGIYDWLVVKRGHVMLLWNCELSVIC